jgi:hypothetical protein
VKQVNQKLRKSMVPKGVSKPSSFLMMPKKLNQTPENENTKSRIESNEDAMSSENCDVSAT